MITFVAQLLLHYVRYSGAAAKTRLSLEGMENRIVPATYLWNPTLGADHVPLSTLWSSSFNWDVKDSEGVWKFQNKAMPGLGDNVVFDGGFNGDEYNSNTKCIVDVTGGATVHSVDIINGYSKDVVLSTSLTITGGGLAFMNSSWASIRGSDPDLPITRGTFNITDDSTLGLSAGAFFDVTVNVTSNSIINVDEASASARRIVASDIYINDSCKLNWAAGDVGVGARNANSHITIMSGGEFNISAIGYTWGMASGFAGTYDWGNPTPTDPTYFGVHNYGLVKATGSSAIVGNYDTTGITKIDGCKLTIDGLVEQTGGQTFELWNDATIRVGGPDTALRIYGGTLIGNGTVDGNLTLGYDPAKSTAWSVGNISPGIPGVGDGTGTLTVTGGFQIFVGTVSVDVTAAGTYDKLVVQGKATLSGTLYINNSSDYKPVVVGELPIIQAGILFNDFNAQFWTYMTWWDDDPMSMALYTTLYRSGDNTYYFTIESYNE